MVVNKSPKGMPSLPLFLAAAAIMVAASGILNGPLAYVVLFAVVFGGLLCARAVVRARARNKEA